MAAGRTVRRGVRNTVGAWGEELAAQHLTGQGMVILDRNWRCELGELDLVARDGSTLAVCEVKTRRGEAFGTPAEAVTWRKAARLRRLAFRWLDEHPVSPLDVRIDVVGIVVAPGSGPRIEHLRGVA
jgi:putative endonuclease